MLLRSIQVMCLCPALTGLTGDLMPSIFPVLEHWMGQNGFNNDCETFFLMQGVCNKVQWLLWIPTCARHGSLYGQRACENRRYLQDNVSFMFVAHVKCSSVCKSELESHDYGINKTFVWTCVSFYVHDTCGSAFILLVFQVK